MNEVTVLVAQLAGPTFLSLGLGMLIGGKYYADLMKDLKDQKFTMMMSAMIMIPLGVLMVMNHNLWGSLPEVIVSILGWSLLLKGVLMGMFPKSFHDMIDSLVSPGMLNFGGLVWLVGGGYLTYLGFFL